MGQQFDQKIANLNLKLTNLCKPQSILQRQSKCKERFLQIRHSINERLQNLQKSLKYFNERVTRYQQKIHKSQQTVCRFSTQKHSQLNLILQQWVQRFNLKVYKAKQQLKSYQVASQIKNNQIQTQNQRSINIIRQKINKTLLKIGNQMITLKKSSKDEQQFIKKQFKTHKNNIYQLLAERDKAIKSGEHKIMQKIQTINYKLTENIHLLKDKWHKKDAKTTQIFQLLVEDQ